MPLKELLSPERIAVRHNDAASPLDKAGALHQLAAMLAAGARVDAAAVERVLIEREQLQSTGIGEGVAIPHGALAQLETQFASLLIVPEGLEFAAIDGLSELLHWEPAARAGRISDRGHPRNRRRAGAGSGR